MNIENDENNRNNIVNSWLFDSGFSPDVGVGFLGKQSDR